MSFSWASTDMGFFTGSTYGINVANPAIPWILKSVLKTAGWTVKASADGGAVYGASSDVLTTAGVLAGPTLIPHAWGGTGSYYRIAAPAPYNTQELVVQAANMHQLQPPSGAGCPQINPRIKWSPTGFTGGAPSATRCPSAADEVVLWGAGTDAAPAVGGTPWADLDDTAGITSTLFIGVDLASPRFYVAIYANGTRVPNAFLFVDLATGLVAGDTNPLVCGVAFLRLAADALDVLGNNTAQADSGVQLVGQLNTSMKGLTTWWSRNASSDARGHIGQNAQLANKEAMLEIKYMRDNMLPAPAGYKGVSTLARLDTTARANGDTYDVASAGAKDWFRFAGLWLPNNGTVPPA